MTICILRLKRERFSNFSRDYSWILRRLSHAKPPPPSRMSPMRRVLNFSSLNDKLISTPLPFHQKVLGTPLHCRIRRHFCCRRAKMTRSGLCRLGCYRPERSTREGSRGLGRGDSVTEKFTRGVPVEKKTRKNYRSSSNRPVDRRTY